MKQMQETLDRIPGHLRQYVVQQDYAAYDDMDQAVWRFTLLQTFNQLKKTAHPSYVKGLEKTGIYLDRIPRIEEMNKCLGDFGWGAVCVDGFIPPRAFQEFQSLRILTIAADIRTAGHLAYTPAPDIIHESAGHAPIIPDPVYRGFLQRFGEVSKKAFSSTEDMEVYEAIRHLSIVKENPNSGKTVIETAEKRLLQAIDNITFTSESALLSRLHWWTVEYGLIGQPEDYKIYGAGILSSVGESFMLHLPRVKKRKLRSRCVEMDYDITEPQPQLYVVDEFDSLHRILDDVVEDFSFNVGGKLAIHRALRGGEVATVELNSGLQVIGIPEEVLGGESQVFLRFSGPCALAHHDRILADHGKDRHAKGFGMPIGPLENGLALSELSEYGLDRLGYRGPGSYLSLNYRSGVKVTGNLVRMLTNEEGRLILFTFNQCKVIFEDRLLFSPEMGEFDLAIGEQVTSAYAGPADLSYWPQTEFSERRVPLPKLHQGDERILLDFYIRLKEAKGQNADAVLNVVEEGYPLLRDRFQDHWLLAWNMLEALTELDRGVQYACRLKDLMRAAEAKRFHEVPVTMGLKYLNLM